MSSNFTKSKYTLFNEYPLLIDPGLACLLGVAEAIIIQQIHYWLVNNERNDINFHKGRYWTYNTIPEWQKQFPFYSYETVKRTLKDLENKGVIISDNFNENKFDKTKWYTIDYNALNQLNSIPYDRTGKKCRTEDYNSLANNETNSQQLLDETPLTPATDRIGKKYLTREVKNTSSYTDTNKQRLTKEEGENFLLKNDFQPSDFIFSEIKQTHLCSDEAFDQALHEFKIFYTNNKIKKRDWNLAFKNWCDNRKSWTVKETKAVKPSVYAESFEDTLTKYGEEEQRIRRALMREFGAPVYKSWLMQLEVKELNDHCVRFKAPSNFVMEWVRTNYFEDIITIVSLLKPSLNRNVILEC